MREEIELHKLVRLHDSRRIAVLFRRIRPADVDLKIVPGREEEVRHLSTDELDTFERVIVDGEDFLYVRRRDLWPVDDSLAVMGRMSCSMAASVPFGEGSNVSVEMDEGWITVSVDDLYQCQIPAPWSQEQPETAGGRMSQEEAEVIAFREVETILGEQFTLLRPSTIAKLSSRMADWIRRTYNARLTGGSA